MMNNCWIDQRTTNGPRNRVFDKILYLVFLTYLMVEWSNHLNIVFGLLTY